MAKLAPVVHPPDQRQQTMALVSTAIRELRPGIDVPPSAVASAMCLPAQGRVELLPGARDLLRTLAERGLRIVVVTNAMWRDAGAHRRDFAAFGVSAHVADYVSSVDVGWRKPHAVFFDTAVRAAGAPPSRCALVGDSEVNDIDPAVQRGMLAVRVAIEEARPKSSAARTVTTSLAEVPDLL